MFRRTAIIVLSLSVSGLPAYAADAGVEKALAETAAEEARPLPPLGGDVDWTLPPIQFGATATKRPKALSALYVSLAAFQAFDGYSTSRGLAHGAREANPLMQGAAGSPAALWAVKAASAAVPMLLAERMWRTNRVGAIVTMAVANGIVAAVAMNNARVLSRQR